jgi:hypothetical protein
MPYIGNPPAERFTSFAYQDLTGGSGTSFTLDNAVGNPQELEVFVNNVRQEPGVAYTVSGTALTMTGSIATTDDFYVVFQGKAIQTATHPSDRALTATDGTFTGDLTVDTNTLFVDATNNRVGINTTSMDAALQVQNGDITVGWADNFIGTQFQDGSAFRLGMKFATVNRTLKLVAETNDNNGEITFETNGSERARVTDNGLTFNGDTAAANALDDYEEGTYTPVISATDGIGTLTYSAQVGRYTKVGNRVSFNAYLSIANKGTVAGSLRITLPFTVKNVANNNTVFSWWINSAVSGQRFDGDTMQFCFASPNSSIALPYGSNGAGGLDLLNAAHVQNGTDFMVGGTYEV